MLLGIYVRMIALFRHEDGSVAMEYGLLLGLIAALLVGVMIALRVQIDAQYRTAVAPLLTGR